MIRPGFFFGGGSYTSQSLGILPDSYGWLSKLGSVLEFFLSGCRTILGDLQRDPNAEN